jgi:hypothetical protein
MCAHRIIVLMALASSSALSSEAPCPAPPVATSGAAICLAKLQVEKAGSQTYAVSYRVEEHKDHWLVVYAPNESNVRGGGGTLKVDKATGQVAVVERYR